MLKLLFALTIQPLSMQTVALKLQASSKLPLALKISMQPLLPKRQIGLQVLPQPHQLLLAKQ